MKWNRGEPPKDKKTYLYLFANGNICSGAYRYGWIREQQKGIQSWRCDCCGNFATPIAWAIYPSASDQGNKYLTFKGGEK